jgi:hypothetical protein
MGLQTGHRRLRAAAAGAVSCLVTLGHMFLSGFIFQYLWTALSLALCLSVHSHDSAYH